MAGWSDREAAAAFPAPGARALGYAGAAAVGVLLGLVAFAAGSADPKVAAGIVLVASAPFVMLAVRRLKQVLIGLLVLDIPFQWDAYLSYQDREGELGAVAGLNLSLTTFALACLYSLWAAEWLGRRSEAARPQTQALLPLLVYLGVNVVSIAVAGDATLGWFYAALLGQMLLLFVYVASTTRTKGDVRFIVVMLLVSLVLEALAIVAVRVAGVNLEVLGLTSQVESALAPDTVSGAQSAIGPRLGGTLGSPNSAGGYLAMLIPIAVSVLAAPFGGWTRRLALAGVGLGFVALILTFSRGGWLATVVAIGLLLVLGVRRGVIPARVLAAVVAAMALLAVPLYGAVGARLSGDEEAAASRVPLMKLALRVIVDRPLLGVGANNFATSIPEYAGPEFSRDWIYTVHNRYLLVAAEAGVIALAAFLWFLIAVLRRGIRAWRARDALLSPLALGLTVALVGQTLAMAVDLYNNRPQLQLFFLVTGLTVAIAAMLGRGRLPS